MSSWTSAAVSLMVECLADSPTFQQLVAPLQPRDRIVAYHSGTPGPDGVLPAEARSVNGSVLTLTSVPYGAIFVEGVSRDLAGIWVYDTTVHLTLRIVLLRRLLSELPSQWVDRAVITAETIRADIENLRRIPLLTWDELEIQCVEDGPQEALTVVDQRLTIRG